MAIGLEFVNVIGRKSAVEAKYPGRLDGFVRQDLANYFEDDHLLRVSFMSTREAFDFVEQLTRAGLCYSDDSSSDLAVVTAGGPAPAWLAVGRLEGHPACWLADQPPGRLINFDSGKLIRSRALPRVETIVNILGGCGIDARERLRAEPAETVSFDCQRGDARVEAEVFTDATRERAIGVWARRDLTRRRSIAEDAALIDDLAAALERTEGGGG